MEITLYIYIYESPPKRERRIFSFVEVRRMVEGGGVGVVVFFSPGGGKYNASLFFRGVAVGSTVIRWVRWRLEWNGLEWIGGRYVFNGM